MSEELQRDEGDDEGEEEFEPPSPGRDWAISIGLIVLTFGSTFWVGAQRVVFPAEGRDPQTLAEFLTGWDFGVPIMGILLAHEFGHYIAGRIHKVDISPPYFIPVPFMLLGTMGAVIRMRGAIKTRNALLDVGAAGPLAGIVVALPVLAYGIATSEVQAIDPAATDYFIEGRSVLYLALIYVIKGPIASGSDIFLTPMALAGWAGLLVTMINLIPVGQLDGGHIAYALWGDKQNKRSEWVRKSLPLFAIAVALFYGLPAYFDGVQGDRLMNQFASGLPWLTWAALLWLMTRMGGPGHPPTEDDTLSPKRRIIAWGSLLLFLLLFMPAWIRFP